MYMYVCVYIYIYIYICMDISSLSLFSALVVVGAMFWCLCCWLWAYKCRLCISDFNDNDIFAWFIYCIVIFCSTRFFLTVNITNFNNYLIYVMKQQVFMVLWSVLRSPFFLVFHFVATSQFDLHCGLIGYFLHGPGCRQVGIFGHILVLEALSACNLFV